MCLIIRRSRLSGDPITIGLRIESGEIVGK
jgi:hypothetical protein